MNDTPTQHPPSEVRSRILADHSRLRAELADMRDLAHRAGKDSQAADALRRSLREFVDGFFAHLALEESELPPVVAGADAWGPERLEHMRVEHAEQRDMLQALVERTRDELPSALVAEAEALVRTILRDMAAEERDLLGENVLRDDVVSIDQTGG